MNFLFIQGRGRGDGNTKMIIKTVASDCGAVGRKLTKVFETFSHKILGRWMDSQPILNIKISIDRKQIF